MDREVDRLKAEKARLIELLTKVREMKGDNAKADKVCWIGFFFSLALLIILVIVSLLTTITVVGIIASAAVLVSSAGFAITISGISNHQTVLDISETKLELEIYSLIEEINFATRYESAHKGTVKLDE